MKIFIICCLLFIHVNMCIFIRGFRVSIRVSGIRGFGFGDGFPPESVSGSGSGSGFDFGFRFWVHGDSTRSEPDPLPFLVFSLYCSRARVIKVQRGTYKLVKQCRTRGSPTLSYVGGYPFYSPRWGPHLHLSSAVSWHRRGAIRPCQSSGPTRSVGSGQA